MDEIKKQIAGIRDVADNLYKHTLHSIMPTLHLAANTIESLSKQLEAATQKNTPKKPKENALGSMYCQCPNCLKSLIFEENDFSKNSYCSNCGQAIDWGEDQIE